MVSAAAEIAPHPRRTLSERQRATVDALLDAALDEVADVGFDDLTIRRVATRAGVTHTTAYTYFSSKDHLVCEAFWRLLRTVPGPDDDAGVLDALAGPVGVLAARPQLAQAALAAMLGDEPDVAATRAAVTADLLDRLATVLGDDVEPGMLDALMLAFSGAMLQAGMGYSDFGAVLDRMANVVQRLGLTAR